MPRAITLKKALNDLKVDELRDLWNGDQPMDDFDPAGKSKPKIVKHLLDNPYLVPASVWTDPAAPPADDNPPPPAADNNTMLLLQAITGLAQTIETNLLQRPAPAPAVATQAAPAASVAPAVAQPAAGHQGEPSPLSPSPSLPHVSAAAEASARIFAKRIPQKTLVSVLNGSFYLRELHLLDQLRVDEFTSRALAPDTTPLQAALAGMLQTNAQSNLTVGTKWPDAACMVRAWVTYASLRDFVDPGIGKYLLGHILEVLRLLRVYEDLHKAVNYFINTAVERVFAGEDFPRERWLGVDSDAIQNHFVTPFDSTSLPSTSSAPPRGSASRGRDLPHSLASRGNPDAKSTCNRWNKGQPCPGDQCIYAHACEKAGCGGKHPGKDCRKGGGSGVLAGRIGAKGGPSGRGGEPY